MKFPVPANETERLAAVRELNILDTAPEIAYDEIGELAAGAAGIVSWLPGGQPFSVMGLTVRRGKIVEIDILADPARLRQLGLTVLDDLRR